MIKRTKKEGFTLIELLVSIAILSIVVVAIGIVVWKFIDVSNEKKDKIMLSSIRTSSIDYVNEFKQEDKYWAVDVNNTDIEYACTTVGMLINKGLLKEEVIGLKLDNNKVISNDTSIRIERNKNTKVNNDSILFNEVACDETSDIDVSFNVNGTSNDGYSNWYNNDVVIDINVSNLSQVGIYEYLYMGIKKDYYEENVFSDDWKIIVDEQGKNIDICLNIVDLKDKQRKFCLSDYGLVYNMDKEKPSVPMLSLSKNSNYQLVSGNANDNVTEEKNLVYYLSGYVESNKGNAVWSISSDIRTSDEVIRSYVIDEAGNKSDVVTGNLNISNSVNISPDTKYYCEENGKYYNTESEARNNCYYYYDGTVYEETVYYCEDNPSREFYSEYDAKNSCSYSDYVEYKNLCKDKECYYYYEYKCVENVNGTFGWEFSGEYSTNNDCVSAGYPGLTKDFICEPENPIDEVCDSNRSLSNQPLKKTYICDYSCKGYETYDNYDSYSYYWCDIDNSTYNDYNSAVYWCYDYNTGSVDIKYYCSVTNKYYSSLSDAIDSCKNQCSKGSYYNGGCYSLDEN